MRRKGETTGVDLIPKLANAGVKAGITISNCSAKAQLQVRNEDKDQVL